MSTIYNHDQVYNESLKYFKGDELAASVFANKYSLKDSFDNLYELTPDDMHRRLAKEFARIESKYVNPMSEEEIYDLIKNFRYIIPQGSPMSGIGNDNQIVSLSNCFVIGNEADSYGGIIQVDEEQVNLMKRRGGVGHDLSHIRPKGTPVKNSALTSTGVVPFMERYSNSTREVAQDGRRGALMLSISSKHPDAEAFIDAKLEVGKITGANVSVRIDDEFMRSVINSTPYIQQFPINSETPKVLKEIDSKKLWEKIIHNTWKSAEPGVLFWDTIIRESVPDCYADQGYKTVSTNPCGEIPLCPYDSCRLIAINLYSYVENPFTPQARFNFELFKQHVIKAQRMMDDLIDLEVEKIDTIIEKVISDPEPYDIKQNEIRLWEKIKQKSITGRRTGLGITAEGDMLAAIGLKYGTPEATKFAVEVQKTLAITAYKSSSIMAKERGAFPIYSFEKESKNPFINRLIDADSELGDMLKQYGRRNIALLTIAPTGSVSIMTQTTSGIEPTFMIAYKRRKKINPNDKNTKSLFVDKNGDHWEEYSVSHPKFIKWLKVNGYDVEKTLSLPEEELNEIIKLTPYYGATSDDVDWVEKVRMQGEMQKWVDHSISVTVNLPKDVSEETVNKIYLTAWESGCKGVTIYRDGSRDGVLISDKNKKEIEKINKIFSDKDAPKRPKRLKGEIMRFQNNLEKWIAVVGFYEGRPYEIFTGKLENGLSKLSPTVKECEIVKNIVEEDSLDANGNVILDANGEVVKIKKKRYDIEYVDSEGNLQKHTGLNHAFNKEFWNYAKLISGIMRHGMPMIYLVELIDSLNFNEDYINTWKNGVIRVMKKYIKDGEKAKGKCVVCGSEHLEYKEGCLTCMGCGSSKCS